MCVQHAITVRVLAFCFLTLSCAFLATAQQRPLLTEDVDIIPPGTLRIQAGLDFLQDAKFPASGLTGDLTRVESSAQALACRRTSSSN
jgi:hypothetical protein